jgi:hypothetical protein
LWGSREEQRAQEDGTAGLGFDTAGPGLKAAALKEKGVS